MGTRLNEHQAQWKLTPIMMSDYPCTTKLKSINSNWSTRWYRNICQPSGGEYLKQFHKNFFKKKNTAVNIYSGIWRVGTHIRRATDRLVSYILATLCQTDTWVFIVLALPILCSISNTWHCCLFLFKFFRTKYLHQAPHPQVTWSDASLNW